MTSLFRTFFAPRDRHAEPAVPDGYRIYAIGDIHGRDDLLADLLDRIERDIETRPAANTILVFLGDLIDRGPASAGVVERLRTFAPNEVRLIFLAGNHEEVLLRILDGEDPLIVDWLRFGGADCMQSYGVDSRRLRRMNPARAGEVIRSAIPPTHVEFLRGFDDTFAAGDYLFVHAGIRPGVPVAEQAQSDLRWIRAPFLQDSTDHGFVVVHGHTICAQLEERPNRIGIDTGAYKTGVLTAIGLEGANRWFLQTAAEADSLFSGNVQRAS